MINLSSSNLELYIKETLNRKRNERIKIVGESQNFEIEKEFFYKL